MSEPTLTVPTAFVDISQLAEGLADRVDEGRLMLYGPEPYEEGAWLRFAVLLADQTAALEGVGRVAMSIDGGEERPEVARWDLVLDSLQLEGMGEVVYERILMIRGGAFSDEPATGEVSLDDVEQVEEEIAAQDAPRPGDEFVDEATAVAEAEHYEQHVQASATGAGAPPPDWDDEPDYAPPVPGFEDSESEQTVVAAEGLAQEGYSYDAPADEGAVEDAGPSYAEQGPSYVDEGPSYGEEPGEPAWVDEDAGTGEVDVADMQDVREIGEVPPSAPPPAPPQRPGGFHIAPLGSDGRVLARPSRGASWYPEVEPPPDPQPSSGLFAFAGGLPVPPAPPRPDLDPSLRIQPAPRPQNGAGDSGAHTAPDQAAPAYDGPAYDEAPAYDAPPPDTTDPSLDSPDAAAPFEGDVEEIEASPSTDSIPVDGDWGMGEDELYDPDGTSLDTENPDSEQ